MLRYLDQPYSRSPSTLFLCSELPMERKFVCTIQLPTRLRTHYIEVELFDLLLCEKQENVLEGSAI